MKQFNKENDLKIYAHHLHGKISPQQVMKLSQNVKNVNETTSQNLWISFIYSDIAASASRIIE